MAKYDGLQTTFEDVFPSEATTIEEYLQQVHSNFPLTRLTTLFYMDYKHSLHFQLHEVAIVSSIQEAQKDNLRSFNNYMMQVLEVGLLLPALLSSCI
jgi:nuclear pore complex protein Nup93